MSQEYKMRKAEDDPHRNEKSDCYIDKTLLCIIFPNRDKGKNEEIDQWQRIEKSSMKTTYVD